MANSYDSQIDAAVEARYRTALADLRRLCNQPSVSAKREGIGECAELVAALLREHGLETQVIPLPNGYSVVFGEAAGESERTMLFYNHYDVQPAEPFDLWDSPPFELTERDGKLYARGVEDNKGNFISRLAAIEAVREVRGKLPCRVKFIVDGCEEIGSPGLADFVAENLDLLQADACVWEGGSVNEQGKANLYLGMRGICYVQFDIQTTDHDAHSGAGGSILPNAAWRLTWALASLKGPDERIRIPGFYDDIVPPTQRDLEMLDRLPDEEEELRRRYGVRHFLKGLSGLDLKREAVFSPTCTICGLEAGYQGPGSKTVLPARASAKVDFRLVPRQDPDKIYVLLRKYLDDNGFQDILTTTMSNEHPARVNPDDPFIKLAEQVAEEVYGKPPAVEPIVGGSGPMYPFVEGLKVPIATPGIGYAEARVHSPNENIRIDDFIQGTKYMARLLDRFARE